MNRRSSAPWFREVFLLSVGVLTFQRPRVKPGRFFLLMAPVAATIALKLPQLFCGGMARPAPDRAPARIGVELDEIKRAGR
jgi:hypothetical protein